MTTPQTIETWLTRAPAGATHMLVMHDDFSHEDYPVYVGSAKEARKTASQPEAMQRAIECYRLADDIAEQLALPRCWRL